VYNISTRTSDIMGKIIDFETEKMHREIELGEDELVSVTKKYLETKNEKDYLILKNCLAIKRIKYEDIKNLCNDESFISIFQMGFILVESDYAEYPAVKYYMAQSMIEEIMMYEIFEIEEKMHMKYRTKENMMHLGINKIILDIIESYDSNLKNYVIVKNDLLEPFKKVMNSIIYNWDEYKRKYDINNCNLDDIVSLVNEFILNNDEFYGMDGTLIYYLEKEFNLNIKGTYLDINGDDVEYLKEGINDVHEVELSILSLNEQKKLQEFRRIIKNYMMSSDKKASYESLKEKVKK